MKLTLTAIRQLLRAGQTAEIVALAGEKRRVLSLLTALTYDTNQQVSDRAVETLGLASARIAEQDPEYVRVHLRRLFWLVTDESGGIGWRAPECIGEILYHNPEQFAAFVPLLHSLFDLEPEDAPRFRLSVQRGIARLAQVAPDSDRSLTPSPPAGEGDPAALRK